MNTEGYFEQDGVKTFYVIKGTGPQLIFLHGVAISTKSCGDIIDELAKHYTVIAPDLPNFGKSGVTPRMWNYDDYADFFVHFIEHFGLISATLAGTSFGGEIALRVAAKSSRISRLVIASATGRPIGKSFFPLVYTMLYSKARANLRLYHNPRMIRLTRADGASNILRKIFYLPRLLGTVIKCIYQSSPVAGSLQIPALMLWAQYDELMDRQDLQKTLACFPNSRLLILDEGHDWPLYKPDIFAEQIQNWMASKKEVYAVTNP